MPSEPKPAAGETRADFMNRCVFEMGELHRDWGDEDIAAACFSVWGRTTAVGTDTKSA